ncbi:MAG: hypothetical protein U9Q30_07375 [Campylobacterota bacterium]|nr:hypothetical protein [Campylobacterota bacterium]
MDKVKQIELKCIFCGSTDFDLPYENYEPKENENLKCDSCGKLNIYNDLFEVAKEEGIEEVKKDVSNEIKKMIKKFKLN